MGETRAARFLPQCVFRHVFARPSCSLVQRYLSSVCNISHLLSLTKVGNPFLPNSDLIIEFVLKSSWINLLLVLDKFVGSRSFWKTKKSKTTFSSQVKCRRHAWLHKDSKKNSLRKKCEHDFTSENWASQVGSLYDVFFSRCSYTRHWRVRN
jgi:hypothetical protein